MIRKEKNWKWTRTSKILVFTGSFILIMLLTVIGVINNKMNKIERIEIEEEVVEQSITDEVEHKKGYLNVAFFGVDTRKGKLGKGTLSDTILVVSLNQDTNEVKMVSVYRDTLVKMGSNYYNKANVAYSFYGPEGAIKMLNQNLDLNIEKYVTVNFNALVDVIDAVDGIDLDLTYEEVVHMNNYCVETSRVTGKSYKKITPEKAGTYHLNGVQAVSYARIRYTAGGDAQRTVRQRIVIGKILEKMQDMDLAMVNEIIDSVFPQIATNFSLADIISYAKDFKEYELGESIGFPNQRTSLRLKGIGIAEIAQTLSSNAKEVHEFLFGDTDYEPSSTLKKIDAEIKRRIDSGYYDIDEEEKESEDKDKKDKPKKDKPKKDKPEKENNSSESTEGTGNTGGTGDTGDAGNNSGGTEGSGSKPPQPPAEEEPAPETPEE